MITYIDNSNKQDYTVLFDKASAKLGLAPIVKEVVDSNNNVTYQYFKRVQTNGEWREVAVPADEMDADGNLLEVTRNEDDEIISSKPIKKISSLNEYFQHITELASLAIGTGRSGSDPYLLRLPLDEPFFEINANTRAISVPSQLQQIGIVGDKLAEVVFFKIDRYYDAVDLNTRHIYIEWEDAEGNKGISRDYLRDTQSEKDKIIFGWAIGDELTKAAGQIRFAVRFVEWQERKDEAAVGESLIYSFSSLPATVTVTDSLHYSLFEDAEEFAAITQNTTTQISTMLFYLENSDPDAADETAPQLADLPVYVRDLRATQNATALEEGGYTVNLRADNTLELLVEAYSPDSGNITYMFGRKADEESGTEGIVARIKFIESTDLANANKIFYKKLANDTFEVATSAELAEAIADEDSDAVFYEKVAYTIVNRPGYYYAAARNNVGGKKTSSKNSDTLYVPYAAKPTVTTELPERFVISEIAYSTAIDETIDQSTRTDADKSNIKVVKGTAGPASKVLEPVITASDSGTAGLTYTWYKSADIYDTAMANATVVEDATGATLTVTEPGCYAVKIDNYFNNDHTQTELLDAGVTRVTRMPVIPTINWDQFANVLVAGTTSIPALEVVETDHDHIIYEWHKITIDNADLDPVATEDMVVASGELAFSEGVASIPFQPLVAGSYYFIIKNELNNATIIMNSALEPTMGVIEVRA